MSKEVEVGHGADEGGWEPTGDWWITALDEGSGRGGALGYIGGLARAQEAAWKAAEEEIARAIFHARYRDPPDLWGAVEERERGMSWEELAISALLVSRETARKRFRDRVEGIREWSERARSEAQDWYLADREARRSGEDE